MAAGIAAQIAAAYPLVMHTNQRDVKAGLFVPGAAQLVIVNPARAIFNLGTQDDLGACARLEWVYLAFRNLAERCAHDGIERVAIPQIGCGIGGLNWPDIEQTIEAALVWTENRGYQLNVVCYIYQPEKRIK